MLLVEAMQPTHFVAIQQVQQAAYPAELWESTAALSCKLQLAPQSCFVVIAEQQHVVAYIFAHPWQQGSIPKLNTPLHTLPNPSNVLYIHDLAVHPAWHGRGLALLLNNKINDLAQKCAYHYLALVAVQQATSFWQRLGFVLDTQANLQASLDVYGHNACYMLKRVSPIM